MTLSLQLDSASGVPFYRQILDQISAMIRAGELEPGSQLPSVRELAAELVVSLITVRRAYAELEQAQLVVRRQGRGTFVADGVRQASKRQSQREAQRALLEAIVQARRLGLSDDHIRTFVEASLDRPPEKPWRY